MRLVIATPTDIVVDTDTLTSLVAEDETGAFGVQPGHADFLTALAICVVRWRDRDDAPHYVAVRNGVLDVSDGNFVRILTREAVTGADFAELQAKVLARFREDVRTNTGEHARAAALHTAALRQVWKFLAPARTAEAPIV